MVQNKVKLVIWDLDDTFWQGTLAEEGMNAIGRNVDIVKELANRGILSSICSKNDYNRVREELTALGVFDYFVFPKISYEPKGQAVAQIIEGAALRAENVLFIDDNPLNLAEVQFFNPGIMAHHPAAVLDTLLSHPNLAGKPDPELKRLNQYRLLQRKFEEKQTTTLSNEEFLRACNIRVVVESDIETHMDRIVELLNRTNQLNFTKRRINTDDELEELRIALTTFGFHAGCVFAADNYGDYGLIGFFLLHRRAGINRLTHFVFSCRTMNMGIEQYVYEMLGRPEIEIVQPVSYGLRTHDRIDWISEGGAATAATHKSDDKLVLLGGCDMLQLATYCSTDRHEFVNKMEDGMQVRYDDPGFILGDRTLIRNSESIRKIPFWTYEDAVSFDSAVTSAELILISLGPTMRGHYFRTNDGLLIRMNRQLYRRVTRKKPQWLSNEVEELSLDLRDRFKLVSDSFDAVATASRPDARIFVFGCYTLSKLGKKIRRTRRVYNRACRAYCEDRHTKFFFVDVDSIVPGKMVLDNWGHFTREGYIAVAEYLKKIAAAAPAGDGRALDNALAVEQPQAVEQLYA